MGRTPGSLHRQGKAAIADFYRGAIARAASQVCLAGPACTSKVNTAGAPLQVRSNFDGSPSVIDIVDVFTSDDEGRILTMQAIIGPSDVQPGGH
jgi:hypothetical protein